MKKTIIIAAAVCLCGAIGYYLLRGERETSAAEASAASKTVQAKRGYISKRAECTGLVASNLDVEIKCKASGQVIALPFDVSDPVKKGELLVELDPVDEARNVKQANVAVSSSRAKLRQAQKNLWKAEQELTIDTDRANASLRTAQANNADAQSKAERMKLLLQERHVSEEDSESAQTTAVRALSDLETAKAALEDIRVQGEAMELKRVDVALAESQVESDEIQLEVAQQRLTNTKVFAPIDGVVASRDIQVGQIISSPTSNVGGGTTLMVLSDLSRMFVIASVDESDIGEVKAGQPAEVTADAFPDLKFSGEVARIATEGKSVSNVVTFDVKIEVVSKDKDRLKPGMTANVEIIALENENALLIPSEAVEGVGGKRFVLVPVQGQKPESRAVETGINDGVQTEVLNGLADGESVEVPKGQVKSNWSGKQNPGPPPMMGMGGRR